MEQVLIHVGDSGGVRVDPDVPRIDTGERRGARTLDADLHARLEHAVALDHALAGGIEPRADERMTQRPDHPARRVERELRVGIQRDHVLERRQQGAVALHDREARVACAAQQPVQLGQLAALALPSHPAPLGFVPTAFALQEEEPVGAVPCVQLVDLPLRLLNHREVRRHRLRVGVGEVVEEGEVKMRIAVREIADLELAAE
jgi:hypothetical protein